jgi:hypothetical protein
MSEINQGKIYKPQRLNTSDDPEQNLQALQHAEETEYQSIYRPIKQGLVDQVDSTALVDDARDEAQLGIGQATARAKRAMGRFGLSPDALQAQQQGYALNSMGASHTANTVNNAFVNQFDRNTQLRDTMINVGQESRQSALSKVQHAGQIENSIENQNRINKAQRSAAMTRFAGAAIGNVLSMAGGMSAG